GLPTDDLGPNLDGVDAEEPLDRRLDVVLGRPAIHLEGVGAGGVPGQLALLGEDRGADHFFDLHDSTPSRCLAAALVRTRWDLRSAASRLKPSTGSASKGSRLRIDRMATSRSRSSAPPATTTSAEGRPRFSVRVFKAFWVLISPRSKFSTTRRFPSGARSERTERSAPFRTWAGGR